ncbi:MAG: translation elongation factor Ts [Dethiobacter sp.]|jgi:elongation factor Ts|nr:translation elongation factor Ts [Dethiobacter sp.]
MMQIDAKNVKILREKTGAGMMDCKKALVEAEGNEAKAITILREKGLAAAARRSGRAANEGVIEAYIHLGGKVGVLVEVNCETDFVARNEEFRSFVRQICLQVAAANPQYMSKDDVPAEILNQERSILRAQALNEGKPEKIVEKIIEGRIEKFYKENCLLQQAYIRDQEITIKDLLAAIAAKIGENIVIRRFTRYVVGEDLVDEASGSEG